MKYDLFNILDNVNFLGMIYRTKFLGDVETPVTLRVSPDGEFTPKFESLPDVTAQYDIKAYHKAAIMDCVDAILDHAQKNGDPEINKLEIHLCLHGSLSRSQNKNK